MHKKGLSKYTNVNDAIVVDRELSTRIRRFFGWELKYFFNGADR